MSAAADRDKQHLNVPFLETRRLILRAPRREDFAAIASMWGDAEVTRFIVPVPLSREEAWARFVRTFGHWTLCGYGFWAVEEKASGRLIGETGFLDAHRDIQPALDDLPEVGWVLARAAWGQGYATEAVGAVLAWGDIELQVPRTACIISPDNRASLNVARKLGFQPPIPASYRKESVLLLYRDAPPRRP
jgi:RimJ/RimL family protein N-acetyltransferase